MSEPPGTSAANARVPEPPLVVAIVTMQFPSPSETFASNEVRHHVAAGLELSVHGLRGEHRDASRLLDERGLRGLHVTHNSAAASVRGVFGALRRPSLLGRALSWLVRTNAWRPRHLLSSLVLVPRAFSILDELTRLRPDVVHLYWGHYPSIVGFLVQRAMPQVAVSMSFIAYDLHMRYGGSVDVARHADAVVTIASVNVEAVSRLTGVTSEAVTVIRHGIELERIERLGKGVDKIPYRLITVGRLVPLKSMGDVIRAFAEIRSRWVEATLTVVGDGPEREGLEALARRLGVAEAVRFLGHVAQDHVIREMARAEVLLLLSSTERIPNAVKEGMACRCVCIATATPGIEELVRDGATGYVVPHGQPSAVVERVDAIFSGVVDANDIAERAQRHIARDYDVRATSGAFRTMWAASRSERIGTRRRQGES